MIHGHTGGKFLDDKFFWPILERAESLKVPAYIHPAPPPEPVVSAYYSGNFDPRVTHNLATSVMGWHIDTAIHVMRLILSGGFDRYHRMQVIIGHLGESLPFMMQRVEHNLPTSLTNLDRPIGDYLRENVHCTISGFNYPLFSPTCCSRSVWTESCFLPIILGYLWTKPTCSWRICLSALTIRNESHT